MTTVRIITVAGAMAVSALSGCASAPGGVAATYVAPSQYAALSCADLDAQIATTGGRRAQVAEDQATAHTRDQIVTGVGVLLFLPALLVLAAPDSSDELARLKGEEAALRDSYAAKDCAAAPQAA